MSASTIATVALRSVRVPAQAAARRHASTVASSATSTANAAPTATTVVGQHSTQKLAIASAVSAVVGVDVTYAYFTYVKKGMPLLNYRFFLNSLAWDPQEGKKTTSDLLCLFSFPIA